MASLRDRVRRFSFAAASAAAVLLTPVARAQTGDAAAQDYPPPVEREYSQEDIPAHLGTVDGEVTLERDARVEAADENIILLAGDRLRTSRGRTEVLFADGSALSLDEHSSVDLLSDELVRMLGGRLRLAIARGAPSLDYRVDTAAGSVFIKAAGEYRLTLSADRGAGPELDLAVLRGSAELVNEFGRTLVRAGTHALVSPRTAPSLPFATNSAAWDGFDRWVEDQRLARLGVESTRYLPDNLDYYAGSFDRYGSWGYEPTYGYVWYPQVSYGWRPYWHGRWSYVGNFGWAWVGVGRWSWPTHHFGRWGFNNRWFWIPSHHWGPAWVSWASAPGYVGWCPLGWNNRPVISFAGIHTTRIDPWIGWTVVPQHSFRPNAVLTRHAVTRQTAGPALWSQFAVQRSAPARPATVRVRENVAPLRAPTAMRGFATARAGDGGSAVTGTSVPRTSIGTAGPGSTNAFGAPAVRTPSGGVARRTGSSVPLLTAPRDTSAAIDAARARSRVAAPNVTGPEPSAQAEPTTPVEPSRTIRSREPGVSPLSDPSPSRSIRSREPLSVPSESTPARSIRSREPGLPPSIPTTAGSIRSRQPVSSPAPGDPSPSWGRSRTPLPRAEAPRSAPPGPRPSSGWMRTPSSSEPRAGAPSRERSSSSPAPAAGRPSSGGGSPSRAAPRSSGSSSPPPSAGAPSRRGGESRAPATSSSTSSSGSSRSAGGRRGGGR